MDSNNMYQNQQTDGPSPDNNQNGSQNGNLNDNLNNNLNNNPNGYYQNSYTQGDNSQNTYTNAAPNYQQNSYTPYNNGSQQPYQQMSQTDLEEPVTMGEWLISLLIACVPCLNIIMMFVWAFSSSEKKSKSNFFKAYLIYLAIVSIIVFIAVVYIVMFSINEYGTYLRY